MYKISNHGLDRNPWSVRIRLWEHWSLMSLPSLLTLKGLYSVSMEPLSKQTMMCVEEKQAISYMVLRFSDPVFWIWQIHLVRKANKPHLIHLTSRRLVFIWCKAVWLLKCSMYFINISFILSQNSISVLPRSSSVSASGSHSNHPCSFANLCLSSGSPYQLNQCLGTRFVSHGLLQALLVIPMSS